jgi:hypothetical protein
LLNINKLWILKGGIEMKEFSFEYPGTKSLEAVEEMLLDQLCNEYNQNLNVVLPKSEFNNEFYSNFSVVLEKSRGELDCEISWNDEKDQWDASAWEID